MNVDIPEPLFTIVGSPNSNEIMAEVEIQFMGGTIGYVGGSRYEDRCREGAEKALRDVFTPLIEAIQAHPEVSKTSRFEYGDEEGYATDWTYAGTVACGAQDWGEAWDEDDDGGIHIYGTCNLLHGHEGQWHSETRDGRPWAAWRGPHEARAPKNR